MVTLKDYLTAELTISLKSSDLLWEIRGSSVEFMQFEGKITVWSFKTTWQSESTVDSRAPCAANHRDV